MLFYIPMVSDNDDLGTLENSYSHSGFGINNEGDIVGDYVLSDFQIYHAFIYSNGTMTDLNDLVDPSRQGVGIGRLPLGLTMPGKLWGMGSSTARIRDFC